MKSDDSILLITLEEIKKILPHEGDKLLLDEITIDTEKGLIVGYLAVREEHCRNHIIGGKPVLRGVDFGDMAFQLLAVGVSNLLEYPHLKSRVAMGRSIGRMTFSKPAFPGTHVEMQIEIAEIVVKPNSPDRENLLSVKKAIVRGVEGKKKAILNDIRLAILKPDISLAKVLP